MKPVWACAHGYENGYGCPDCDPLAYSPQPEPQREPEPPDERDVFLDKIGSLEAVTTRLVALVKWLEFSKHYKSGNSRVRQCPICGGIDPKEGGTDPRDGAFAGGHSPDCPVAAEIAALCGEE